MHTVFQPGIYNSLSQGQHLATVYSVFGLIGFAKGFYSPASSSLKPYLVKRAIYANSSTWSSSFWQAGVCDSVSVIVRQTILQIYPPDEMRGRVAAVNGIFVSSSNELGAFESGGLAKAFGTVPSVMMGGVLTIGTVSWIYLRSKDLFSVKLSF